MADIGTGQTTLKLHSIVQVERGNVVTNSPETIKCLSIEAT